MTTNLLKTSKPYILGKDDKSVIIREGSSVLALVDPVKVGLTVLIVLTILTVGMGFLFLPAAIVMFPLAYLIAYRVVLTSRGERVVYPYRPKASSLNEWSTAGDKWIWSLKMMDDYCVAMKELAESGEGELGKTLKRAYNSFGDKMYHDAAAYRALKTTISTGCHDRTGSAAEQLVKKNMERAADHTVRSVEKAAEVLATAQLLFVQEISDMSTDGHMDIARREFESMIRLMESRQEIEEISIEAGGES